MGKQHKTRNTQHADTTVKTRDKKVGKTDGKKRRATDLSVVLGELHGVGDLFQVSHRRLTGTVETFPNANGVNPPVQQLLRLSTRR